MTGTEKAIKIVQDGLKAGKSDLMIAAEVTATYVSDTGGSADLVEGVQATNLVTETLIAGTKSGAQDLKAVFRAWFENFKANRDTLCPIKATDQFTELLDALEKGGQS